MHGRRKRQEVSGKVGEAPSHLLPVSAPATTAHIYGHGSAQGGHGQQPQQSAYRDEQWQQQQQQHQGQQQQLYAQQQQVEPTYTAPSATFAGAVGPIPPPNFQGGGDYLMPSAVAFPPQGTTSGTYSRDIRSAGLAPTANAFGPPSLSPRGLPTVDVQPSPQQQQQQAHQQQQAYAAAPPTGSPMDLPLYGRRAHTTDATGRDQAKEQRQLEYQREIAAQAEQARERKRLEKERIKREDDALEQRVVEDRMKLANKEREEREKEVRDRDEKEAAALGGGKRRGGNHQPPQSNVSDHQRELLQQIEERKQRKQAEEVAKLRDDMRYNSKFNAGGAAAAAAAAAPGDTSSAGFPAPSPSSRHQSQPLSGQASAEQPHNPFLSAQSQSTPPWMPNSGTTAGGNYPPLSQQQYGGNGGGQALSSIKDEIFSMLVDHHRQQQASQQPLAPPDQFPPFSLSSPQYQTPHGPGQPPTYNHYGGYGRQQSIGQQAPYRPPPQQQPSASTGQSVYGSAQSMFGGGGGGYYGVSGPGPASQYSAGPSGGGGGGPVFPPAPLSYQPMYHHQPTPHDVLQRFVEEDLRGINTQWAQQHPSEDVSLELPGEPSKFLGRRDGGGRRR